MDKKREKNDSQADQSGRDRTFEQVEDIFQMEQHLSDCRDEYMQIAIPDRLDEYAAQAVRRAYKERRSKRRRVASTVACVLAIALFVTSVRVSTVFAAFVAQIPGLDVIVRMIQNDLNDQGLQLAVENELMQPIGLSDEHDDIKVTVEGIIMDEVRMNLFYTVEMKHGNGETIPLGHRNIEFEGDPQPHWKISTMSGYQQDPDNPNIHRATVNLEFDEQMEVIPEQATFLLEIPGYTGDWRIPFTIDTSKFTGMKETITIGQTVSVEGQSFTFTEAVMYPTRILLKLKLDPNNAKQILGFRDLHILNERGEKLTSSIASGPDESNEMTFYFESNYLAMPKELYIEGGKLSALDKDKLELVIDLDREKIVRAPDDRITLDEVWRSDDVISIYYSMHGLAKEDLFSYSIGGEFHDETGTIYNSTGTSTSSTSEDIGKQDGMFQIPNKPYQGLLTFKVHSYPTFIKEPFRVKVK